MNTPKKPARARRGRPEKAPGGLNQVLLVRVDAKLVAELDRWLEDARAERGPAVSRADLVREALHGAVKSRRKRAP